MGGSPGSSEGRGRVGVGVVGGREEDEIGFYCDQPKELLWRQNGQNVGKREREKRR